jgi:hypothetical protein
MDVSTDRETDVTWGQLIRNMITLYDKGKITKEKLAEGMWKLIEQANDIEREVNAQTAENMGSYVIAEAIRKGD